MASSDAIVASVRKELDAIYDPCSLSAAMPVSIVDLGLVRSVTADEEGNVEVTVGATSPGCVLCPTVMWRGVQEVVTKVDGVRSANLRVDTDFFWTPAAMNQDVRAALDARRAEVAERDRYRPQEWRRVAAERATATNTDKNHRAVKAIRDARVEAGGSGDDS